eukprot:22605-Amphidinium_carterae.1
MVPCFSALSLCIKGTLDTAECCITGALCGGQACLEVCAVVNGILVCVRDASAPRGKLRNRSEIKPERLDEAHGQSKIESLLEGSAGKGYS